MLELATVGICIDVIHSIVPWSIQLYDTVECFYYRVAIIKGKWAPDGGRDISFHDRKSELGEIKGETWYV